MNVAFLPVPYGGAFIIVSLLDGVPPFHVSLRRGPGGGYDNHLRHFVTPPPAEDSAVVLI